MEKLIELLAQIQDLAGVAIEALKGAEGGEEKKPEGGPPREGGEGGPPPPGGEGGPPREGGAPEERRPPGQ